MPGVTLPADHARQIGTAIARIERSERLTLPVFDLPAVTQHFSYPGALADNIESPPWYVPRSGLIELVRVSLTNAASADHTIEVRVNGASAQQFTLTSGSLTVLDGSAISVNYQDYVTIQTISVFDSDLAVELRLR